MDDAEERVLAAQSLKGKRVNGAGVDGGIPEGTGAGRAKVQAGGAQEFLEPAREHRHDPVDLGHERDVGRERCNGREKTGNVNATIRSGRH